MSLSEFEIPTKEITLGGTHTMTVRGLSTIDLSSLLGKHAPMMTILFEKFKKSGKKNDFSGMTSEAMKVAPDLIADIIAIAADEPGQADKVKKLRPLVQIEAIEAIAILTFESDSELEKFIEAATRILLGLTKAANKVTGPSA